MSLGTTNWNVPLDEMKEAGKKSIEIPQLKGAYEATLVEAVRGFTNSGAEFVKISAIINGLKYSFQPNYLFSGDAKGNKPLFDFNVFMGLLGILGLLSSQPKLKKMMAHMYNPETKNFEDMLVDQYFEVLNKPVGIIAETIPIEKAVKIDGYTKLPVTDLVEPQHIYFNDPYDIVAMGHRIIKYFDIKTNMTYGEIESKKTNPNIKPIEVSSAIKRLQQKEEKMPTVNEMDKAAERTLKSKLSLSGIPYNPSNFVSFAEYGGKIPNPGADVSDNSHVRTGGYQPLDDNDDVPF